MTKKIVIQRMGQTMKEGTITRWLKKEGDYVEIGDKIYVLEYDKASVEVESFNEGYIHILEEEGSKFPVGTMIAQLFEKPVDKDLLTNINRKDDNQIETEERKAKSIGISASAKRLLRHQNISPEKIDPANGKRVMKEDVLAYLEYSSSYRNQKSTPLARKIANDNNIKMDDVLAIERGDRIISDDVNSYLQHQSKSVSVADKCVPMSPMRKTIALNMSRSYFQSPVVTYTMEIDMSAFLQSRKELNEAYAEKGAKVSINDLLIKATAVALRNNPEINVSLENEDTIVYKSEINIGMAVAVIGGLLVPVIKHADQMAPGDISIRTKELIKKALNGQLSGDEMSGGTFTITNLGSKGIDAFTPIINPPETAILGLGRCVEKPIALNGTVVIHPMMTISMTADHRVIDGAPAADFLQELRKIIEKPILMLA